MEEAKGIEEEEEKEAKFGNTSEFNNEKPENTSYFNMHEINYVCNLLSGFLIIKYVYSEEFFKKSPITKPPRNIALKRESI